MHYINHISINIDIIRHTLKVGYQHIMHGVSFYQIKYHSALWQ